MGRPLGEEPTVLVPTSPRPPYVFIHTSAATPPATPARFWAGVAWAVAFETLVLGAIALVWFARG